MGLINTTPFFLKISTKVTLDYSNIIDKLLKTKLEEVLEEKHSLICNFDTYSSIEMKVSSVYSITDNGIKKGSVNENDYTEIQNYIEYQNLTLVFTKNIVSIGDTKKIYELVKPLLLDSKLNVLEFIKRDDLRINFFGQIRNSDFIILSDAEYHNFNQPFYGRTELNKNYITSPTESEFLKHYSFLNNKLIRYLKS